MYDIKDRPLWAHDFFDKTCFESLVTATYGPVTSQRLDEQDIGPELEKKPAERVVSVEIDMSGDMADDELSLIGDDDDDDDRMTVIPSGIEMEVIAEDSDVVKTEEAINIQELMDTCSNLRKDPLDDMPVIVNNDADYIQSMKEFGERKNYLEQSRQVTEYEQSLKFLQNDYFVEEQPRDGDCLYHCVSSFLS